jgi:hypothetical protein
MYVYNVNNSKVYNMRNTLALVNYNNTQRLAYVKSIRKASNKVNVTIFLFANSSIASDLLVDPEDLVYTNIDPKLFTHLAKSYPNYAATDSNSVKLFALQQQADSQYPSIAKLRNNYEPYTRAA